MALPNRTASLFRIIRSKAKTTLFVAFCQVSYSVWSVPCDWFWWLSCSISLLLLTHGLRIGLPCNSLCYNVRTTWSSFPFNSALLRSIITIQVWEVIAYILLIQQCTHCLVSFRFTHFRPPLLVPCPPQQSAARQIPAMTRKTHQRGPRKWPTSSSLEAIQMASTTFPLIIYPPGSTKNDAES